MFIWLSAIADQSFIKFTMYTGLQGTQIDQNSNKDKKHTSQTWEWNLPIKKVLHQYWEQISKPQ